MNEDLIGKYVVYNDRFSIGNTFRKITSVTKSGKICLSNGAKLEEHKLEKQDGSRDRYFRFTGDRIFARIANERDLKEAKVQIMREKIKKVNLENHCNVMTKKVFELMKKYGAV